MKNLIQKTLVSLVVLAVSPSVAYPAYVLKLVNGNVMTIPDFWEEVGEIKFYAHGGVIGIARDAVQEIRFSNTPPDFPEQGRQLLISSPIAPILIPSSVEYGRGQVGNEKNYAVAAIPVNGRIHMESEMQANIDEALKRFRQAARSNDGDEKRKAIKDISGKLRKLVERTE